MITTFIFPRNFETHPLRYIARSCTFLERHQRGGLITKERLNFLYNQFIIYGKKETNKQLNLPCNSLLIRQLSIMYNRTVTIISSSWHSSVTWRASSSLLNNCTLICTILLDIVSDSWLFFSVFIIKA